MARQGEKPTEYIGLLVASSDNVIIILGTEAVKTVGWSQDTWLTGSSLLTGDRPIG